AATHRPRPRLAGEDDLEEPAGFTIVLALRQETAELGQSLGGLVQPLDPEPGDLLAQTVPRRGRELLDALLPEADEIGPSLVSHQHPLGGLGERRVAWAQPLEREEVLGRALGLAGHIARDLGSLLDELGLLGLAGLCDRPIVAR